MQDSQSCIPLTNRLKDRDIILLLTPGVAPDPSSEPYDLENPPADPFEPLGKALARRHPWVRHVPYVPRNGITGTHVVHIRLAAVVIFVVSGPPRHGQPSQVALAEITKSLCEHRPHIVLACCDTQELGPLEESFPTTVKVPTFTPSDLESAANALFAEPQRPSPKTPNMQNLLQSPQAWPVTVWDGNRDPSEVLDLWSQCVPKKFHLGRSQFQSLLRRDGYAMHYVVREPGTSHLLGFCATYTTYADCGGERLLGSLAVLIVHPSHRQRGIGFSLHEHALRQLAKTRGVCRMQLGSAFPRLLYGVPIDSPSEDWFRRRGWPVQPMSATPGAGQEICDWILTIKDWPATGPAPPNLSFRPCELDEFETVLAFVEKHTRKQDNMGWYDQYAKFANTMNIRDIIVGFEDGTLIAVALTYAKNTGSPAAEDLPWASAIGDDVGGVTCVCLSGEYHDRHGNRHS